MGRRTDTPSRKGAAVLDLEEARGQRRLKQYEKKIRSVLEGNRRALNRLFVTNLLYTRQGTRAGRDLLLAHQNLMKLVEVLKRVDADEAAPGRAGPESEALFGQLDGLLQRTSEITSRTGEILGAQRKND